MNKLAALAALALLAGCREPQTTEPAEKASIDPAEPAASVAPATSAAEGEAIAEEQRKAADQFEWTGRFAATPALCTGGVWDIRRDRIVTAGETSCETKQVEESGDRAALTLACTAEGTDTDETWTLTRRGDGMTVERDTGSQTITVGLVRCK